MKPLLTYFMSMPDATALVKKMNIKKHRNSGHFFELDDDVDQRTVWRNHSQFFKNYNRTDTYIVRLRIFYEKPNETLSNKGGVPN
jgi:hypothetical protein